MSLRRETPCDFGPCPYDAEQYCSCEYWCGADEPEDSPYWEFDDPDLDPYDVPPDGDEAWEDGLNENGEAWTPPNFDEEEDGW